MYIGFSQTAISDSVILGSVIFSSFREATHVELQADTQNIRYVMDNSTSPSQTSGMVLIVGAEPKLFLTEDAARARFVRGAGSDAKLNAHFIAGRDI